MVKLFKIIFCFLEIIYLASLDSIHTIRWINFFSELKEYNISCISNKKINTNINKNVSIYQLKGIKIISIFLKSINLLSSKKKEIIHVHYLGWNSLLLLFASKTKK